MALLAGKSGSVKLGANTVAEMDTWNIDAGPELKAVAAFGDLWEEFISLLRGATGSFAGRFDDTDTNGALALNTAALGGTTVTLNLYVDGANYWSMTAYVRINASADLRGTVDASFNFTATGAVTWN